MKVKIAEFFPYIVIMVIFVTFIIFATFIYCDYTENIVTDSAYSILETTSETEVTNFSTVVERFENEYISDSTNYDVVTITSDVDLNDDNYFLSKASDVEDSSDEDVYVYCYLEENSYLKLVLSDIADDMVNSTNIYSSGLMSSNGSVYYGNGIDTDETLYSQLVSFGTSETVKNEIKTAIQSGDDFYLTGVTLNSDSYYICLSEVSAGFYYVSFYTSMYFASLTTNLDNLSILYRVAIASAVFIILVDIYFIFRKQNKLLRIRRKQAGKRGTAILRINKRGKIIYFNKGKNIFNSKINNLSDFTFEDEADLVTILKKKNRFIGAYTDDFGEQKHYEFINVPSKFGYFVIVNDITNEYQNQEMIKEKTRINSISKLPNKYALIDDFEGLKNTMLNKDVTIFKIKIIEFKQMSKTLGYSFGDQLLLKIIQIIKSALKNYYLYHDLNDTLILILYNSYSKNLEMINKVSNIFTRPLVIKKSTVYIHTKIVYYEARDLKSNDFDLKDILNRISITLGNITNTFSNNVVEYDKNLENSFDFRINMTNDIQKALKKNEFKMFYQPQYNLKTNKIEGFEALIRWDNDRYRSISPQVYIEAAEKNGDIIEIGRFVNRTVFKDAKEFEKYGIHISINVSPAQLLQSGFIDEVLNEFKRNDLKPGSVCVEITETFLMENYSLMVEKLKILRKNGFSIHLDDFGTGYSSMLYLKDLPIDVIKTDKEFIKNIITDRNSGVIEQHIINLAKDLNLKVISEGVETKEQMQRLMEYGADYVQGYLISKAVNLNKALEMVENKYKY